MPWLAAKRVSVKASTYDGIEGAWQHHVAPIFGGVSPHRIRASDIKAWVVALAAGKSPTVVWSTHAMPAQVRDSAVQDRLLAVNPARGLALPRVLSSTHRYLPPAEVHAVTAICGTRISMRWPVRWTQRVLTRLHTS